MTDNIKKLLRDRIAPIKLNQVIEFRLHKKTLKGIVYEIGYLDNFANVKVSGKKYFIKRAGNIGVCWKCVNEISNLSKETKKR